jgi:hypothetical protein
MRVITGSDLADLIISESFPVEVGNLGLSQQAGTWHRGNNSLRANGTFEDVLSAGGLIPGTRSGEGLQVFSARYIGVVGTPTPLQVLGFGNPTTVLHNVYQPGLVTINGTITTTPCP